MARKPSLNHAQLDELARRREAGHRPRDIARDLGVTAGTVYYYSTIMGVDGKHSARIIPRGIYARRTGAMRTFSPDEDARVVAMSTAGLKPADIARALGRANNSVRMRLFTLARYDARAEAHL